MRRSSLSFRDVTSQLIELVFGLAQRIYFLDDQVRQMLRKSGADAESCGGSFGRASARQLVCLD